MSYAISAWADAWARSWEWTSPYYILAAVLALVGVPIVCLMVRRLEKSRYGRFSELWSELVGYRWCRVGGVVRTVLVTLAVASLLIALAQPRDGYTEVSIETKGRNILVAVDISRSMEAVDLPPSRLQWAQRKILDFIDLLKGDHIALMIFAGEAYIHLPLTRDYGMARLFTQSLSTDLISAQGTNIGRAIEVALKSLNPQAEVESQRAESRDMVIITDGENHDGSMEPLAGKARQGGVRIFTVGVGSVDGSPLEMADGRFIKDDEGRVVISRLDEDSLKKLASYTGGIYVRSGAGDDDLKLIYEEGIRKKSTEVLHELEEREYHERFPVFIWLSVLFSVAAFLITPYKARSYSSHLTDL